MPNIFACTFYLHLFKKSFYKTKPINKLSILEGISKQFHFSRKYKFIKKQNKTPRALHQKTFLRGKDIPKYNYRISKLNVLSFYLLSFSSFFPLLLWHYISPPFWFQDFLSIIIICYTFKKMKLFGLLSVEYFDERFATSFKQNAASIQRAALQ